MKTAMRLSTLRFTVLILCVMPLHADEATQAASLTLTEAINQAHQRNETREIAAARLQHALALRRQALALLLPSLSASASLQKNSISDQPFARRLSQQLGADVSVGLTLFNVTSIESVRAAGVSASAQELDSAELRRVLAFQVTSGFLSAIAAEHQLQAARNRRLVAAQTLDQTKARVQAGVATGNDATRSELELATAELTVTNDTQAVLAARLSLGDLVGRTVDEPLQEPALAVLPNRELAQLQALALAERADLRSSALRLRATDLQINGTRLGLVPTIGVRGSYGANRDDPSPFFSNSPQWQVALVSQWNLYDGGNREATVEALAASRREADATLRASKRTLYRDIATALGALNTAELALSQAETQLKVAKINADEVQARFRQGLATALQAADANASVFQAESDLTSRQLNLQSSRFQLRELSGRWPLSDIMPGVSANGPDLP